MKRGFSLVEILIVLGIMVLVASISIASFVSVRNAQALDRDTDLVVETLRQARSQTLVSLNDTNYGIHFSSGKIILFSGSAYSAGAVSNKVFNLGGSEVAAGQSPFTEFDIVFNRLSGETGQNGTIIVSSPSGSSRTITVYKTGLIEFQ